jgi:CRP/FNR family cyclic AMP-dependent transcriptional regulator
MTDPLFARFGREFLAGDVLFKQGDPGDVMYVVQSGLVQVLKRVGEEERPLATLGRGEFLGEMAILNGKPRTATAVVLEDAKMLVIDGKTLEAMITRNPEIAMRLIKKLARRLDSADEMIQILMNPDPKARVMLGLKRHAESGEGSAGHAAKDEDGAIRINTSSVDLAREVGTEEEHVVDVLARLQRLRIAWEDELGSIVIADVPRLLEFMEFLEMPGKFEA